MDSLQLLPEPTESMRCTDFSRRHDVDPAGTAIRADVLVAVEVPLPWPKPVFAHEMLAAIPDLVDAAPQPSRVLAAVPAGQRAQLEVVAYRRDPGTGAVSRTAWCADPDELPATVGALLNGTRPVAADPVVGPVPSAEVWVCTQGSHDMCCGSEGTRLAGAIDQRWTDVVVRRVSHTGGHRFAPTAVTLPDGRMWSHLDEEILDGVLRRTADPRFLAARCRGWWGSAVGAEQVAERAVFAAEGWAWESAPRWTEVIDVAAERTTVRVSVGEGRLRSWLAEVVVGREIPTIACRAPGGLPAKPGREYAVLSLVPDD